MNTETRNILQEFDEQGRFETPSKFDYETLVNRVDKIANDPEQHFGLTFKIDNQVQDASFHCNIRIPHELVLKPRPNLGSSVRISNFGGLATINFEEEYSGETISTIKEIIERHDFIYVSYDELDQEYDGQFEEFKKILDGEVPTWQIRISTIYDKRKNKKPTHNKPCAKRWQTCEMKYREIFNIENELPSVLGKVSEVFSIETDDELLRKIQLDSIKDQVNEKRYEIATVSRILRKDIIITGIVEEYEPETIWLELTGLTQSELDILTEKIEKNKHDLQTKPKAKL
jgi:hypothetical protein